MTRFRLALIVASGLLTVTLVSLAAYVKRPGGTGNAPVPEAVSYAKPTADGRHVLVAFGDPAAEAKLTDATLKRSATTVRATYARPGLYQLDDPATPVYILDGYAPDDQVFPTADGRTVVRVEGEWWKTKAYPAGKRLDPAVERALLDSPALTLFRDGRPVRTWKLSELVDRPQDLPHSPEHVLWPAGAVLNLQTNQFFLFTQDSNKLTLDLTTGEMTKAATGLGNPIAQATIWGTVALTAVAAAAILWFTIRGRRTPEPMAAAPAAAP